MDARWARTARGWSIALLAGVLTAALHASAGGGFPSVAVLLLAALLAGLISTALAGPTPSTARLAASGAASQVTFHAVFTALGHSAGAATVVADVHAGHTGHGMLSVPAASVAHAADAHAGPGMIAAHLVAGIASALLLAHGERALRMLHGLARFVLRRLASAPTASSLPLARPLGTTAAPDRSVSAQSLGVLRHRGPPALLRAA